MASAAPQRSLSPCASRSADTNVYLRVDHVGKWEARALLLAVWALTAFVCILAVTVVASAGAVDTTPTNYDDSSFYRASAITAGICLGITLLLAVRFAWRLYQVRTLKKVWSRRRRAFCIDAGVLLALNLANCVFWLVPHIIVLAHPDRCGMSAAWVDAIGALAILRYTTFSMVSAYQ
jgi:hypothetical protein